MGFVGSSTAGIILLRGGQAVYRFKNPVFGRSRVEGFDGEPLLSVRVRYLPRFRTSFHLVDRRAERGAVVSLLGVLACLTVISVARPSLHWTTLFAGAPPRSVQRLKGAMRRELPSGGPSPPRREGEA